MKKIALCILGLNLAMIPCHADVIPSQYDDKDPAAKQTVQGRMEGLGLSHADAGRRVQHMTSDELAYFAGNPDRIQAAGGLYWYEWVFGTVMLGAVTAITVWRINEYNDLFN